MGYHATMINPRHIVAMSRGVPVGSGCLCAVCEDSPFDAIDWPLGDNFSDWDCIEARSDVVCAGCRSLLSGRPGDDPPPLRTLHVLAVEGRPAVYPARAELEAILRSPPGVPFVLVIAESRQRHAVLRADISTSSRLYIGTDTDTVIYTPATDLQLLDAVGALCIPGPKEPGFTRDQIRTGSYSAGQVLAFGVARWDALEAVVRRYRPSPLLDLLCLVARANPSHTVEVSDMIDPHDQSAAELLASIASNATIDKLELNFWGGLLRSRLERWREFALPELVSRLLDCCRVPAHQSQAITARLLAWDGETCASVLDAIRTRPALLCAYAYDICKNHREIL